ncbi:MAG: GTP-binding protein, partial [Pseudobdellovibrionaceae bacterium]
DLNGFKAVEKNIVVLFSSQKQPLVSGKAFAMNQLNEFVLNGNMATFDLHVEQAGNYGLFLEHCPHEFKMSLTSNKSSDALIKPAFQKHFHGKHSHDNEVGSVGIEMDGDLDPQRFQNWIGDLLQKEGQNIYRSKGILSLSGEPKKYVFQGVHMLMDGQLDQPWGAMPRKNMLVFIGKNLNRQKLNQGLKSCLK